MSQWNKGVRRQYLAAIIVNLASFSRGCSLGWSAPILKVLLSENSPIPMTADDASWVIAIMEVGNYLGPIPAGYLVDRIGRKWSLLLTGPIYTSSWIVALFSRSVGGLYAMRILQGIGMSMLGLLIPIYLAEMVESHIRGTVGTLSVICCQMGIIYTYILGAELSYRNYTISNIVIPILFTITFMFMPESPYYLLSKNKDQQAIKSLKWFRDKSDEEIQVEITSIKKSMAKPVDNTTNFKAFFERKNLNPFLILSLLTVFKQFTNVQSIIAYANTVFASTESFIKPDYVAILFAVILLVSILPCTYFVDRAGRRPLLIISSMGCSVASLIACVFYYVTVEMSYSLPDLSWVPFFSISLLGVFFNIGLGSLNTALAGECFSVQMKATSGSLLMFMSTTFGLISYKLFYVFNEEIGMYSNFVLTFLCSILSTIFVYFCLLETKGKTLAEIQDLFQYGKKYSNTSNIEQETQTKVAFLPKRPKRQSYY